MTKLEAYNQAVAFTDQAWRTRLLWGLDDARALKDWRACYEFKCQLLEEICATSVSG